ncbi:MAG: UDP-N-acetylglucosamine 1-carboxyvinyltransferase [Firmicutes bacterium]|nr:UDP-N-acetylglucosamine 1-carboxyvinyltransferase [Bacillota bacterium]
MSKFVIEGRTRLSGEYYLSGSKNSSLSTMVAAALSSEPVVLDNIPANTDVLTLARILQDLGAEVRRSGDHTYEINGRGISVPVAPYDLVRRLRGSFYVMGLLLAKLGRAEVPFPGGDAIGARGIDFHLQGFRALGAEVHVEHGYVKATAERLKGANIYVGRSSVGVTVNMMLAACLAEGVTTLENAAREPEIVDLAICLNTMGANVRGAGTSTIKIEGVPELGGGVHEIIPDRIEAGTIMAATLVTAGEVVIENCVPEHVRTPILKLQEAGAQIEESQNRLFVAGPKRPKAVSIETMPYPGFPTDLQPQMAVIAALASGVTAIRETIFESRFGYADELRRMGVNIDVDRDVAIIRGTAKLTGAPVETPRDIRGAVALVLAGMAADGVTEIYGIEQIDRGYERIEEKLNQIGARISRVGEW